MTTPDPFSPAELDRLEALAKSARDWHAPDVWAPDSLLGGFVCGACGQPTESEPCALHQCGQALLDGLDPLPDTIIRLIAAARSALDVERLARALHKLAPLRIEDIHGAPSPGCREYARLIAGIYATVSEPKP